MRNIKKLANFNRHFAWREDVMLLFGDCTAIASESRYKAIKGKMNQNINSQTNVPKIIPSTCTSKSR